MALSVNNPSFRQLILALLLLLPLSFHLFAQDNPPPLEAAWANADPLARIEALQKFLQTKPEAAQADTARAELTRIHAYLGEKHLAEKNMDAALQQFKQAIAAFPLNVEDKFFDEVAVRIPVAVSVRGYRTEAILLAREIEARCKGESKRLTALGEFYLSVEAPGEALRALNTAAKLAPDNARIYRTLGAAHRVNLNLTEAATQYQLAIKADPKDPRAYFELGNLQRARGNYELAVNLYNHQLSLDPEHVPSLKSLALCQIAQGNEERAAELFAQAAKLSNADLKQDFYFQTQLALTYLARNNTAKARQAAEAALTVEPRFSWARIAAAEVELAEGKYFESERHVIAAMKYADFPTLHFLLGKIYLAVEDFEGALGEFNKAFSFKAGQFQTRLGGAVDAKADSVVELLAPERQASLFQAEPITSDIEFKLAENLTRFEDTLRGSKQASSALLSSLIINQASNKPAAAQLEKVTDAFVETEGSRKPFRWLYAAERLTQSGQGLETVLNLTAQALDAAESATAPEGSLRDYPNYDQDGRLRIFRGRALTLRGRALAKLGRPLEAITTLAQAVESYGTTPERKRAQWQLALAKESAGQPKEALDLYIAAYEPPDKTAVGSDLNRAVIESLYRKVHGSLDGLNDRIGKAREEATIAAAKPFAPLPVNPAPTATTPDPAATKPAANPLAEPAAKSETTTEEPAAEVTTDAKPEAKPEAEPKPEASVALPEARVVAAVLTELAPTQIQSELALAKEDAPPLGTATTVAANKATEAAAVVVLPDSKIIAPVVLSAEELTRTEVQGELALATKDAPLSEALSSKSAETTKAIEEVKPVEVAAPIELPTALLIARAVLPTIEDSLRSAPAFDAAQLEVEEPAPPAPVTSKPEAEAITSRTEITPQDPTSPSIQLSDSRVAEIERAISGAAPGGKKGDSSIAVEESVNGHLEGDAPVRLSKPLGPVLPAGESGHVADTMPKARRLNEEEKSPALPEEVELRARTMGQSAGKLSAGAAMEIEAPDKPSGGGRKGVRPAADPEENKTTARPRRVTAPEEPPKGEKKPKNQ